MDIIREELWSLSKSSRIVGKVVRGDLYFHVSAAKEVSASARTLMDDGSAIARLRPAEDFNVIKIGRGGTKVSLLFYTDFLNDPFPKLGRVCTVDLEHRTFRHRSYRSKN